MKHYDCGKSVRTHKSNTDGSYSVDSLCIAMLKYITKQLILSCSKCGRVPCHVLQLKIQYINGERTGFIVDNCSVCLLLNGHVSLA